MTEPTPPAIALLPPDVANQIAAGEVVERPASVLKELVENALDAGARSVTVQVDGGGAARLAVTDDGHGMSAKDLALSVVRHATSKIRVAEDLVGVATYGFRGEALASIGSVARLRVTSRARGADEGAEVVLEGGADPKVKPAGCAVGTTVSVEELFFNTPVRKKFLRTAQTEWGACADVMARLALPRPDVRFVLRRDGRPGREWLRQDTILARAREIFGEEPLADLSGARGSLRVGAFLGPPERARSGGTGLALYVNGRYVRDRLLMRAVAQAYGSTLEGGRYPVGAVLIEVPPADVDVNVHPQKAEVRFATQNDIFSALVGVLREGLDRAPWARAHAGVVGDSNGTPASAPGAGTAGTVGGDYWSSKFSGGPVSQAPVTDSLFSSPKSGAPNTSGTSNSAYGVQGALPITPSTQPGAYASSNYEPDPWGIAPAAQKSQSSQSSQSAQSPHGGAAPVPYDLASVLAGAASLTAAQNAVAPAPVATPSAAPVEPAPYAAFGSLRYVAQLRRMFLVCEGEHGMVLLDQHAAAERVTFDRLRRSFDARQVASQPLLVPETVEVTAREVALAEERAEDLLRAGVELSPVGPTTLAVRAVPALLGRADPRRLARDILSEIDRQGNDFSKARDLVLATMACHGSVRGGEELADEEARALLKAMDETDFAGHCPHGRPVVWSMRWTELERKLGR